MGAVVTPSKVDIMQGAVAEAGKEVNGSIENEQVTGQQ